MNWITKNNFTAKRKYKSIDELQKTKTNSNIQSDIINQGNLYNLKSN